MTAPPNTKGLLFGSPETNERMELFGAVGSVIDHYVFGGKIKESTQNIVNNTNSFFENHPSLQTAANIVQNTFGFATGFGLQVVNDVFLGIPEKIVHINWDNGSDAFQYGRQSGQTLTTVIGAVETAVGLFIAGTSAAAMPPTGGFTAACGALTGGGCLPFGGLALTAEGVGVAVGTGMALHGGAMTIRRTGNFVSGPKRPRIGDPVPGKSNTFYRETKTGRGPNRDYEVRVTGKSNPNLAVEVNGVEFDWYDGNTLIDAKNAGETRSWYDVSKTDNFTQSVKVKDILNTANRQLRAAKGTGFTQIEWRVADESVAQALSELFYSKRIRIDVVYVP